MAVDTVDDTEELVRLARALGSRSTDPDQQFAAKHWPATSTSEVERAQAALLNMARGVRDAGLLGASSNNPMMITGAVLSFKSGKKGGLWSWVQNQDGGWWGQVIAVYYSENGHLSCDVLWHGVANHRRSTRSTSATQSSMSTWTLLAWCPKQLSDWAKKHAGTPWRDRPDT